MAVSKKLQNLWSDGLAPAVEKGQIEPDRRIRNEAPPVGTREILKAVYEGTCVWRDMAEVARDQAAKERAERRARRTIELVATPEPQWDSEDEYL